MRKYMLLLFFAALSVTPAAYASYVYFYPPDPVLSVSPYPSLGAQPYREAYKPYPAPHNIYYYNAENRNYIKSFSKEFQDSRRKIEQSIRIVDNAAKDFDDLVKDFY